MYFTHFTRKNFFASLCSLAQFVWMRYIFFSSPALFSLSLSQILMPDVSNHIWRNWKHFLWTFFMRLQITPLTTFRYKFTSKLTIVSSFVNETWLNASLAVVDLKSTHCCMFYRRCNWLNGFRKMGKYRRLATEFNVDSFSLFIIFYSRISCRIQNFSHSRITCLICIDTPDIDPAQSDGYSMKMGFFLRIVIILSIPK